MNPRSLQILERLLSGAHLTANDLDELISQRVLEDQYIEYKHGSELTKNEATDTIRDYISGFANSAGGVLVIGIDAPEGIPLTVTGCQGHHKRNLAEWAARCLNQIASQFSPFPRFHVVQHPAGEVLVGATQRSLSLVHQSKYGGMLYHFRLHDQTLKAPDYLMADLLLGRRQQPVLEVTDYSAVNLQRIMENADGAMDLQLELRLQFENMSIVWADEVRWGIVAWIQGDFGRTFHLEVGKPSSHLLSFIDIEDLKKPYSRARQLIHVRGSMNINKPFDIDHKGISVTVPLKVYDNWYIYTWKAALYITTRQTLPAWYQISFVVNSDTPRLIDERTDVARPSDLIAIEKIAIDRPIVAWKGFDT